MWSKNGTPVAILVAPLPSRSIDTVMSVSRVARSTVATRPMLLAPSLRRLLRSLAGGEDAVGLAVPETVGHRLEEPLVLLLGADRDTQAVGEPLACARSPG